MQPVHQDELGFLRRRVAELELKLESVQTAATPCPLCGSSEPLGYRGQLHDYGVQARLLIENLPGAAVFIVDHNLRFTLAGGEALNAAGLNAEMFIGRRVEEVVPQTTADRHAQAYRCALAGHAFTDEHEVSGRTFSTRGVPLRAVDGSVFAALAFSYDITDRKDAELELERLNAEVRTIRSRLQSIIEQMPSGLFVVEAPTGRILIHNAEAERLLGHPAVPCEGYEGYAAYGAIHSDGRAYAAHEYPTAKALLLGETIHQEDMLYRRGDGALVHLSVNAGPIKDGEKVVAAVCTFHDITAKKELERALHESRRRVEVAMRAAGLGAWESDLETGSSTWDDRILSMLDIPPERRATAADRWLEHVHPDDQDRVAKAFAQSVSTHTTFAADFRVCRPDGEILWLSSRAVTISTPGGGRRMIGVVQDITTRKQIEERLRQHATELEQVANSLPQIVWVARPDGYHEWFNRRWYEYTGATIAQSIGKEWCVFFHPEDMVESERQWKHSIATGAAYEVQYRCRRHDGEWHWFLGRAEAIRDQSGTITRWFGTCTDIDHQKQAERDLERSNQDLERFAFAASHDLQEPIRMIASYSQLLARRYRSKLSPDADEWLQFISEGADRMSRLIRDLLVYSRWAQTGDLQIVSVDLNSALQLALANLQSRIEEVNPSLTWDRLPVVPSVEGLLAQVFQNLIGNALKYTRPGARPQIHVSAERTDKEWVVSVEDNGAGIAPEYQQQVFGLFVRLHGKSVSGTGIGLATCKRIVERLGGRIWVESEVGIGSRFRFTVPSKSEN